MKVFAVFAFLLLVVNASLIKRGDVEFRDFKIRYGKTYKDQTEEAKRLAVFSDNLKSIEEHNALYEQGKVTWKKGITKFTDLTDEEFQSMLALQRSSLRDITGAKKIENFSKLAVPDTRDWREEGQVTEVKDQGDCAASYAFSVTGSVEGAYYRKSGQLVPLSEQQILDCSSEIGNLGCTTGYLRETMPYISWHGLQSETTYPYKGVDEECQYNSSSVVTKINSFVYFYDNQYQLKQVVGNIGPVSASFDGSLIKDYKSGIFQSDDCVTTSVNLAVLVVGYGVENGTTYWIVKNCWGTEWGEDGYIRIFYKANYLACGLYVENVYPIIN